MNTEINADPEMRCMNCDEPMPVGAEIHCLRLHEMDKDARVETVKAVIDAGLNLDDLFGCEVCAKCGGRR